MGKLLAATDSQLSRAASTNDVIALSSLYAMTVWRQHSHALVPHFHLRIETTWHPAATILEPVASIRIYFEGAKFFPHSEGDEAEA